MIRMSIKYPLNVIDARQHSLTETFSWILNYFDPNKKNPNVKTEVFDVTCSKMEMWNPSDLQKFNVTTNDLNPKIKSSYHYDCKDIWKFFIGEKFDIIIYDPPYVNLKNRKDSEKHEKLYNYDIAGTIKDLEDLTTKCSLCFSRLLNDNGIIITKITNFHYKEKGSVERLRGSYDYVNWFGEHFYIYDEVLYRFFKPIRNLNWYSKKLAKTYTYFQIYKKNKK